MRTIDPILADALANQKGELILRVNTWADKTAYDATPATPAHTWTVKKFDISSTSASAELVTENDYTASAFSVFIIERGVKIEGVEYTVESGLFFVIGYQEDYGQISITGSSYPKVKIAIPGDGTYQEVIEEFCTTIGKTAVFKNPTDTWLSYQFLPTGKILTLNKAEQIENLLKQKYTILVYEESPCNLVFYNQDSYPSSALNGLAEHDGNLLAVATTGASGAMTSENATDWTPQSVPSFYNAAAYSPALNLWVAVGADVAATSPDRATWTAQTIPAGTYNSIAWSDSLELFCAVGTNICATSTNGTTWTAQTITTGEWKSIASNNNIFVAIGANACTTSTNGANWTSILNYQTIGRYGTSINLLSDGRILTVAGRNSAGVVIAETYFGTISDNTITWANGTDLPTARYRHTTNILGDGRILVTGGFNSTAKAETYFGTISGNTITWANGTDLPAARYRHTASILGDGRILVTGGYNSGAKAETYFGTISGNTITWENGTNLPEIKYSHTANILSDGRVLITGGFDTATSAETYFGTISGNTITWANGTDLPTARDEHALVVLDNTRIVVTKPNGVISTIGEISSNTISWIIEIPTGTYNSIVWSNDLNSFCIVGTDVCATSPESMNWTARTIPAGTYYGVCWSGSLFVAVGASACATSPDGTTWTARTPAEANNWQACAWSDTLSLFVAVANNGLNRVMYSADGITWNTTTANADFSLTYEDGTASHIIRDQSTVHYIWRDEAGSIHTDGDTTLPQWNLGYLTSSDSPPITRADAYYKIYLKKAPIRLDITDGDKIHFAPYWSIDPSKTIDAMMQVSEHLDLTKAPAWYQEIKSIIMFNSTEGGAMPSTIERVAAYTPLVSTGFDGNLTPAVNNLQALAQAVDDMTVGGGGIPDAPADGVYYGRRNTAWTNLKTYFDTIYATIAHGSHIPINGAITQILQWASSGVAKWVTISGDATIADGGVLAVNKTRLNVRNETGSTIASTRAVYTSGYNNLPLILLADNTNETKHNVIGLTIAPIAHQADGFIATSGQCDAETNGWTVGTELYLSTSGTLSSTEPTSGSVQHVGIVTVQANYPTGKILIYTQPEGNILAVGSGQDAIIRLGDSAGANKISFRDYANTEVASLNSDGGLNIPTGQTYNINGTPHTHAGGATTKIPFTSKTGLILANNATDANNDIDVSAGYMMSTTDTMLITLASSITKRLDAGWAVGTNQGGLDTGSKASSTWYHVFAILRSDTSVVDVLFSTSVSAPTMPANYDYKRRIGAVKTDGSGNILAFYQYASRINWKVTNFDLLGGTATTRTLFTVAAPSGLKTLVFGVAFIIPASTASMYLYDPDISSASTITLGVYAANSPNTLAGFTVTNAMTNTSAQLAYYVNNGGGFFVGHGYEELWQI